MPTAGCANASKISDFNNHTRSDRCEELHELLRKQKTASSFERIQALYLLKIGQVKTIQDFILDALFVSGFSVIGINFRILWY